MTIAEALAEFYGRRWQALPADSKQLLTLDAAEVASELVARCSPRQAVQELDRRIAGKLESYVLTLHIGQRRAGRTRP